MPIQHGFSLRDECKLKLLVDPATNNQVSQGYFVPRRTKYDSFKYYVWTYMCTRYVKYGFPCKQSLFFVSNLFKCSSLGLNDQKVKICEVKLTEEFLKREIETDQAVQLAPVHTSRYHTGLFCAHKQNRLTWRPSSPFTVALW